MQNDRLSAIPFGEEAATVTTVTEGLQRTHIFSPSFSLPLLTLHIIISLCLNHKSSIRT